MTLLWDNTGPPGHRLRRMLLTKISMTHLIIMVAAFLKDAQDTLNHESTYRHGDQDMNMVNPVLVIGLA